MSGYNPYFYNENTTAWLSTTGSQIFFMQLGFLCYEAGFVQPVWTQSIILKNIEDTFVGILTFLAVGFTLSESEHSFYGIISIPTQPLLIGVDIHMHDQILISAFFASTCATIISGAVLERMVNKAYILWCLIIIIINYSFISHWVWHPDGWLNKLGFVDGAGAVVVHSTAGMAALVAIWRLGPRKESINTKNGNLLPVGRAARPIIHATGAFFLWYGWFAFNVASPIAMSKGIGDAIGTTALVTVISPICSSCAAFLWMSLGWVDLSFEHLLSCLLSGLVVITGPCHTCNVWEAAIIGVLASAIYFPTAHLVRNKWHLDDPMQVISIHFCCGIFSCFSEGIVANNVYGTPGLIYGGYEHFFVQILGVVVISLFNFIVCVFLYDIVLKRMIFGDVDIRVSILDVYLGTRLFDQNYEMAFNEVLACHSDTSRKMLLQFHEYIEDRFAGEQLNFLVVIKIFGDYLCTQNNDENRRNKDPIKIAKYILQIIDTYIEENGIQSVNVSGTQRSILLKIKKQLLFELCDDNENNINHDIDIPIVDEEIQSDIVPATEISIKKSEPENHSQSLIKFKKGIYYKSGMDITVENIFKGTSNSIWKIVVPHFTQFLRHSLKQGKKEKFHVKIPFTLESNWTLKWDDNVTREIERTQLTDTVPKVRKLETLLNQTRESITNNDSSVMIQIELQNKYPVIFNDEGTKTNDNKNGNKAMCGVVID